MQIKASNRISKYSCKHPHKTYAVLSLGWKNEEEDSATDEAVIILGGKNDKDSITRILMKRASPYKKNPRLSMFNRQPRKMTFQQIPYLPLVTPMTDIHLPY
jgi:hypothetical protein